MQQILTLQFGHFANYVGTHFWNIQEEYVLQNDITSSDLQTDYLFREGKTMDNTVTYTPRLMIFDLKGSLGGLRKGGYQYDEYFIPSLSQQKQKMQSIKDSVSTTWYFNLHLFYNFSRKGDVEVIQQQIPKRSKFSQFLQEEPAATEETEEQKENRQSEIFADLESNVNVWSDYLRPFLHHKSVCEVATANHGDNFDVFTQGSEIMNSPAGEEYWDNFRFFVEESDYIKGFQVIVDQNTGWGAFASAFIDSIRDEIGLKYPIITLATTPCVSGFEKSTDQFNYTLTSSLSLSQLYQKSNLLIPLHGSFVKDQSFNYTPLFDVHKRYHLSSLFANAFDTISTSYRQRKNAMGMDAFSSIIQTLPSIKIASLCSMQPFPIKDGQSTVEVFENLDPVHQTTFLHSLSPPIKRSGDTRAPYSHHAVLRGISDTPIMPVLQKKKVSVEEAMIAALIGRKNLSKEEETQTENKLYEGCQSHAEVLERYLSQTKTYASHQTITKSPMHIPESYPHYFSHDLLANGFMYAVIGMLIFFKVVIPRNM